MVSLSSVGVFFSEVIEFKELILTHVVDALECISFILAHVAVPGFSKLSELLSLDVLDIEQFLVLAFFHSAHLSRVLYLC